MFQLNLYDFLNDENQENYKKFLSCEKSEIGSPLQIRQQNQLKKMIQNHNQLSNIYDILSAFPFEKIYHCYHYQRHSKLYAQYESEEIIGIWNIEKDQQINSIKMANKINEKRQLVEISISSDNTTVLQVSQQKKETLLNFTDLEQQNCQEVRLENGRFKAFWKKEDKVFILFQIPNFLQLYSLSLYNDQKLSLNVEGIIDVDDWENSYVKPMSEECFYVITYLGFTIRFLKNFKKFTSIPLNGSLNEIQMLVKGILLIQYNFQLQNLKIIMRQTWGHKSIRHILGINCKSSFLYESFYVIKHWKTMCVAEYSFYDLFQGEEVLKIITPTYPERNINPSELKKILLDFQREFL